MERTEIGRNAVGDRSGVINAATIDVTKDLPGKLGGEFLDEFIGCGEILS